MECRWWENGPSVPVGASGPKRKEVTEVTMLMDNLSPPKARMRLMLLIEGKRQGRKNLQVAFERHRPSIAKQT